MLLSNTVWLFPWSEVNYIWIVSQKTLNSFVKKKSVFL